jgi:hypothetical protein
VTPLDVLGLEVGYRLIPLVDKSQDGELLRRIRGIRKKFAQEVGFLVSPVHIRDNLELKPNAYKILLKGVEIGEGEAFPGICWRSIPAGSPDRWPGTATRDPAFGLPAVWIDPALREQAQAYGYTVVDAEHGHRDAPQPSDPLARRRTPRAAGDAGPARSSGQGDAQAGRGRGAQGPVRSAWSRKCCATCSKRACICATCAPIIETLADRRAALAGSGGADGAGADGSRVVRSSRSCIRVALKCR